LFTLKKIETSQNLAINTNFPSLNFNYMVENPGLIAKNNQKIIIQIAKKLKECLKYLPRPIKSK
jgi:hypothetical protein